MVAWSANTLYERSNIWSDKYTLAEHNAKTAPLSPSANITLARLQYNRFIEGESEYGEKSKTLFLKTISLKPDQITEEFSMIVASEYGAFEYDSEWLNDAIAKLPQSTPTANVKNAIRSYLKCLHANRCKKSEKEAHKFFDALLESNFSSFRNFYALYYSKIDNQPEKSEPVFESLTQSSSTDYWLNYLEHLSEQPVLQPFCTKYAEFAKKLRNFEFKRITKHINAVSRFESLYKRCPV